VVNSEPSGRFLLLSSSTGRDKDFWLIFIYSESEITQLEEMMDEDMDELMEFHRRSKN
jgi:hypothetical protein